jgi:hypothetical protein
LKEATAPKMLITHLNAAYTYSEANAEIVPVRPLDRQDNKGEQEQACCCEGGNIDPIGYLCAPFEACKELGIWS